MDSNKRLEYFLADAKIWAEAFNRDDYKSAYQEFCQKYESYFINKLDEVKPEGLAEALLSIVEETIHNWWFWRRKEKHWQIQLLLSFYLTPMLLETHDEKAVSFAEALCAGWEKRWPKQTYKMAKFQTILGGFRRKFLSFDMGCTYPDVDKENNYE